MVAERPAGDGHAGAGRALKPLSGEPLWTRTGNAALAYVAYVKDSAALRVDPRIVEARVNLGTCLAERCDLAAAVAEYREARRRLGEIASRLRRARASP